MWVIPSQMTINLISLDFKTLGWQVARHFLPPEIPTRFAWEPRTFKNPWTCLIFIFWENSDEENATFY